MTIIRTFNAPRVTIWQAWTDPEMAKRWWGPKDYTIPTSRMDVHVGGKYVNCMRSPGGEETWATGRYLEVVAEEKLAMTDSFSDSVGNVVPASYYGMSTDFPLEMLVTVTFEDLGDQTTVTLQHDGLPEGKMTDLTEAGWNESFDKLDAILKEQS